MKENFPNLVKETDFHEVREAQRVPKKLDPTKEAHTKAHHNYITQHDRGENLKSSKREETVIYKGVPIRLSFDFSKETLQARRYWKEIFSHERQGPISQITLSSKAII